jgi:uncharacterized protein (TIGR00251 family)
MIAVQETAGGATFSVRTQPRARKNAVVGEVGDALKISLTAPPVSGKANQACIALLAELLNVPRGSVTIIGGQTSRNKIVCVAGLSARGVQERLHSALP